MIMLLLQSFRSMCKANVVTHNFKQTNLNTSQMDYICVLSYQWPLLIYYSFSEYVVAQHCLVKMFCQVIHFSQSIKGILLKHGRLNILCKCMANMLFQFLNHVQVATTQTQIPTRKGVFYFMGNFSTMQEISTIIFITLKLTSRTCRKNL